MKSSLLLAWRWSWHPKTRLAAGLALSLAIAYWVMGKMDWHGLSGQFDDFPVHYALASLFIFFLAVALRAYRWQVLFVGERVPLHRLLLVQNAGIGLNSVSPVRVFSEAVQFVLLTLRYRMKRDVVVATLGLQRVLDSVIGALLLGVGLMLLPGLENFTFFIVGVGVVATLSLLAIPVVIWFGTRPWLSRIPLLSSASGSLRDLTRARLELTCSFVLTLGYWLLLGLAAWVLAYGMGIKISVLLATLVVIGTVTFASTVPSLPASVGTFEFAVYYMLTAFGIEKIEALGFALVIHAILFTPPILIAALVFSGLAVRGQRSRGQGRPGAPPGPSATLTGLQAVTAGAPAVRMGAMRTGLARWCSLLVSGRH